jgi:hypothetical protein
MPCIFFFVVYADMHKYSYAKLMLEQGRQCPYVGNTEAHSHNHCCRGKAVSVTYSECVSVALVTVDDMRVHRIILSSVACLAVPYFSTLSHE